MNKRAYSEQDLIDAIKVCTSKRQVLLKLNLAAKGGNYTTLLRDIDRLKLDTSHFTGQASNKDRVFGPKRLMKDYLSNNYFITSHQLRLRLLKEGIFEHVCHNCKNIEWLGNPIPLELEHVDGNPSNNNLGNLMLLCPNCHTLTSTYRGKNKKKVGPGEEI